MLLAKKMMGTSIKTFHIEGFNIMETIKFIDREGWGPGEWENEPDYIRWYDEETTYHFIMRRGMSGSWCGYVGIPETHPCAGKHHDDESLWDLEIHGGLTYSGECEESFSVDNDALICHPKKENEPERYWFGFDCGHCYDVMPWILARGGLDFPDSTYKNVDYVKKELKILANQLKKMEKAKDGFTRMLGLIDGEWICLSEEVIPPELIEKIEKIKFEAYANSSWEEITRDVYLQSIRVNRVSWNEAQ